MSDKNKKVEENRDGLALIIGGLLVLTLVFGAYSYFNRNSSETENDVLSANDDRTEVKTDDSKSEDEKSLGDKIKDFFGMDEDNATTEENGDLNGDGAMSKEEKDDADKATGTGGTTEGQMEWQAKDYAEGDISGESYTVKEGDTLWEIAEARYGNGAEWTRILDANSANIGYLANGQHALIMVDQVLVLP